MLATDAWCVADPCGCPVCGRDSCEDGSHVPPDDRPATPRPLTPKLAVISARDVIAQPRPAEILEGVAFANCVSVLVSESGAGKTFVLLSMAAAIADGVPWMGRATAHGGVIYVGFEGDALGVRLRALKHIHGHRLDNLHTIPANNPISPRIARDGSEQPSIGEEQITDALAETASSLAAAGAVPIRLIIVDTVRASLSGSEDSSENVSAYLRAVRRLLARVPGTAAILAHHAGWQDTTENPRKRERGSSAFRGNVDATLYLEAGEADEVRGETALILRTLKLRDAEKPPPLNLIRRRVELLEMDCRGEPLTTCVIDRDRRTRADREAGHLAVVSAANKEADLRTLRAIVDRPDVATAQDRLALLLNVRKAAVGGSLSRLVGLGWALPGKRGHPYAVTDAGRQALAGKPMANGSQFPTVPNGSPELAVNGSPVPTLREPGTGTIQETEPEPRT
jgi:AAA domain-containing protein